MTESTFNWFKRRQELFCKDSAYPLASVLSASDNIERSLFQVQDTLGALFRERKEELLDTLLFYFDTQIEDLESIANLSRGGLFSSASVLLRRVLLSLARISFLIEHPSQCDKIRQGKQLKDKDLMSFLESISISRDKYIYPSLCESTHLNFNWVQVGRLARSLGPIDEKSHLLLEGIVLTALRFVLQTATILSQFLAEKDMPLSEATEKQLGEHSYWWRKRYDDFRQRVDNVFGEE